MLRATSLCAMPGFTAPKRGAVMGRRALTLAKIIPFPRPHKEVTEGQDQLSLGKPAVQLLLHPRKVPVTQPGAFPASGIASWEFTSALQNLQPSPCLCIKNENICLVKGLNRDM